MIQSHHLYPLFPDLLTSQKKSVQLFWEKGVLEEFELFSYIIGKKKNLQMILHGSKFMLQKPKYTIEEAIRKQKSYSVSLFLPIEFKWYSKSSSGENVSASLVPAELLNNNVLKSFVFSPFVQFSHTFPVFLGDIPLMTERGNFFINGSARVLVNQIVRCPSVYFKVKIDHKNRRTYIASFLSDYGSWLRLETDYKSRIWVRIDKSQRVSIYALLRSLGFPESFLQYQLKYYSFLFASRETYYTENPNEAIQYLWKKLTPGRWNSIQGCYAFLYNKFFNPRRYSIGPVGRLRLNKRLNRKKEGNLNIDLSQDPGQHISFSGQIENRKPRPLKRERPTSPSLPTLTPEDVFLALDLLIQLHYGEGHLDDIDHLKNRRVRLPGELIQNQFRLALSRITQVAGEKITKFEVEKELYDRRGNAKPHEINKSESKADSFSAAPRPLSRDSLRTGKWVSGTPEPTVRGFAMKSFFQAQLFGSSIRELFHTSQLSQYMDQTNPLAEITHKRRLSSLGPGGIGRDQAGFAVREIHPSHFGRICPIETPEGPNAGLVGSLASYCRITENGFLQSPYFSAKSRKDEKPKPTWASGSGEAYAIAKHPKPTTSSHTPEGSFALHFQKKKSEWFLFSAEVEDESYICSENGVKLFSDPEHSQNFSQPALMKPSLGFANESSQEGFKDVVYVEGKFSRNPQFDVQTKVAVAQRATKEKLYPTRYKQEFLTVEKNQIQFFSVSPIQMISLATSLIPFLEHDDANRALMGSNMQRQAVPILFAEKPFIGTGLEIQAARDSSTTLLVKETGQVTYVDAAQIIVESQSEDIKNQDPLVFEDSRLGSGEAYALAPSTSSPRSATPTSPLKKVKSEEGRYRSEKKKNFEVYKLQNYWRSNQNTCLRQRPQVSQGEWVEKGDLLADGSATQHGEIALGKNILLAYMPWEGYNFEDAIVISERLVQEDIYTSIHIDRYDIEIRETSYGKEKITRDLPYINSEQIRNLDHRGIIHSGTWVEEGDILVGKITPISPPKPTPEYRLLLAIFETKPLPFKETSLRVPQGVEGRVLDCIIEYPFGIGTLEQEKDINSLERGESTSRTSELHIPQKVQIFLAHKRKIQLGDKMSGRHGNKGIVSLILPPQDMPFLQDGTPVDIVLNPLGVPSRMNVGQVLECLFGLAAYYLKQQYRLLPFDEVYGIDASRGLVYQKLYEASRRLGYGWLFDPNSPGKSHLFDGRTGEPFHQPILVGYSYMFKLIHLVDEKMHARSTGPYSLVTQQPLGGRSKHGGQRLGEMEVWALEGFGAASILQEFLTVKSDEIYARNTFLFHLMKRRKLPRPGLPESFRVLVHELQSLCLSVYYNPDFRLTYPSLIGWDGLFLLSSKKFPTLQQLSNLKNI